MSNGDLVHRAEAEIKGVLDGTCYGIGSTDYDPQEPHQKNKGVIAVFTIYNFSLTKSHKQPRTTDSGCVELLKSRKLEAWAYRSNQQLEPLLEKLSGTTISLDSSEKVA